MTCEYGNEVRLGTELKSVTEVLHYRCNEVQDMCLIFIKSL